MRKSLQHVLVVSSVRIRFRAWRLLACIILLSAFSAPLEAEGGDLKPGNPGSGDKCPVCGMFVARYESWLAQIIFRDGTRVFFDGPKDMFKYYMNVSKYSSSKSRADIVAVYVTEYYSAKKMDAKKVLFVAGSDVYGPMGAELVPVEDGPNVNEFMKDHNGKKILKFADVKAEDLR